MKLYRSGSGRLLLATDKEVLVQKLLYPMEWGEVIYYIQTGWKTPHTSP